MFALPPVMAEDQTLVSITGEVTGVGSLDFAKLRAEEVAAPHTDERASPRMDELRVLRLLSLGMFR